MERKRLSSQSCTHSTTRLRDHFERSNRIGSTSHNSQWLCQSTKTKLPVGMCTANVTEKSSDSGKNVCNSGISQQVISSTKAGEKMAPSNRSQCSQQSFNSSNIQNGNRRGDKKLHLQRGVGSFCRSYRRVFSHSYSPKISKPTSVSCRGAFVPVQSTTLRHCDGSTRIHSCSQGGKADASKQGYSHPPVFRRLAFASSNTADLHGAVKTTGRIRAGTRLGDQLQKIRVNTNSKIRFPGLQVRPGQGRGFAYRKKMANFEKCHRRSGQQCHNNSQDPNVFHRDPGISREDSPNGQVAYETLPMVLENPLEVSPIIGQDHPMLSNFEKTSHMVERSKKCFDRVSPTCRGAQSPVVYRCFGQGLGSTFGRPDSQWTVVGHRDKFAYKHSGTKSSVSSNKVFSNPSFEQESLGGLRQFNSGGLPQQTGGDSFTGNVSHVMASHGFLSSQSNFAEGSTHSGLSQCDSRQPLTQGQGHTDRMVSSSQNFSKDLPNLAQTNDRLVCHQNEQQATPICVSSPRSKCNGGRCIEHLLGGNGRLCLLSNSSNSQSSPKDEVLCMSNDCSGPRVARDELVLGSHRPVHKTSTVSSTLGVASEATIQSKIPSKPSLSQSSCLASGLETKSPQKFSSTVAERIKAPQRFSSRRVYESRWSIFESWGKEKQVEFEQPSISTIADFLIHLFNEKNLKPTTIAGYRTAIADHLGPAGNDISHSFELNRLIASFHRDRPVKDRGVPSWDLSLVLLALTKSPFEPLKDAPLKLLTFKTVFLMTLASGRRRGEVHAWTFKSLKHKAGWKEVTVAPSSVFLSKNQLASDGPNVVQPVVIPALKPILDSCLSQDMTLCPVRSLRYYVDKTKDIRDGKHLLFVSFKNGFSGDIQRATISSWIKQTVILAYQESDLETQKLSRVKAHDVRSMAASLAFKGGVSLDQILGACFWKSHTTFTNFYLKDVSWKSKEGAEYSLGSVVSAQHIVHL